MTPPYVPSHLKGKVQDFRQEADGSVSFLHPEEALGLGPSDSRTTIPLEQYKQTFDPGHRWSHFDESMRGQYRRKDPTNRAGQLQGWIADKLRNSYNWGTSSQGKSVATAGLLSALAGGAAGAYLGHQQGGGAVSKGLLAALLAGTAGAGLTAYGHDKARRREAFLSKQASDVDRIILAITSDHSMSPAERAACLRAAALMSENQRDALARQLRTVAGAGAGALVVRFMLGNGLIPTLAGGILGALAGHASGPGHRYNAMGQLSLSNYR